MEDIKSQINQLIEEAKSIAKHIPDKSAYKNTEMEIKGNYKQRKPLISASTGILGKELGREISSMLGGRNNIAKNFITQTLRNKQQDNINQEINNLWRQYAIKVEESKRVYENWYNRVLDTIKSTDLNHYITKLEASKQKLKLETKLRQGISTLRYMLNLLENPSKFKKTLLIKTGEPIKGRDEIIRFMQKSNSFIKIQDPFVKRELLRIIEEIPASIKVQILTGVIDQKDKFKEELKLLRKSGRNVNVVSILAEMKDNKNAPFHDRFILTDNSAIKLGTSISGYGLRDSTITELNTWAEIEKRFDEYIEGKINNHRGFECKIERL